MKNAEQTGTADAGTAGRLVSGMALVDIPSLGLKCGQFSKVDSSVLVGRVEAGEFDPNAVETVA